MYTNIYHKRKQMINSRQFLTFLRTFFETEINYFLSFKHEFKLKVSYSHFIKGSKAVFNLFIKWKLKSFFLLSKSFWMKLRRIFSLVRHITFGKKEVNFRLSFSFRRPRIISKLMTRQLQSKTGKEILIKIFFLL